jgi:hypothetical protein
MCRQRVTQQTLFYLPYCTGEVTDNILKANWDRNILSKVGILGNSFGQLLAPPTYYVFDRTPRDAYTIIAKAHDSQAVVEVLEPPPQLPSTTHFMEWCLTSFHGLPSAVMSEHDLYHLGDSSTEKFCGLMSLSNTAPIARRLETLHFQLAIELTNSRRGL